MPRFRRLTFAALSAIAVTAVSFVGGATMIAASIGNPLAAGGKGGGCGVGAIQCRITQTDAFASWFNGTPASPGPQVFINPTRSTFVSRPRGGEGTATVTPLQTVLNIQVTTPTVNGGGCFVIADSAFVVSRDLQTATLNVSLNSGDACTAVLTPALGANQAGPLAGGGGPPPAGLSFPLTVSVTWTGPGLPFKSSSTSTQSCGDFKSSFRTQGSSSQGRAAGTLTFADGTTLALGSTLGAGVDDFKSVITSNGFPGPRCMPI